MCTDQRFHANGYACHTKWPCMKISQRSPTTENTCFARVVVLIAWRGMACNAEHQCSRFLGTKTRFFVPRARKKQIIKYFFRETIFTRNEGVFRTTLKGQRKAILRFIKRKMHFWFCPKTVFGEK